MPKYWILEVLSNPMTKAIIKVISGWDAPSSEALKTVVESTDQIKNVEPIASRKPKTKSLLKFPRIVDIWLPIFV